MEYENFILKITNTYSSYEDKIAEILKARGFFIEKNKYGYYLSDNSYLKEDDHSNDSIFLNSILISYNIGCLCDSYIKFSKPINVKSLCTLFSEINRIPREECFTKYSWNMFTNYEHGRKIPVKLLDPFVARYIKSISACGVDTVTSCDGNNHNDNILLVGPNSPWGTEWHKLINHYFLLDKFQLPWRDKTCTTILLTNKFETYYLLNKASEFLYDNRFIIRKLKRIAVSNLKGKAITKKGNDFLLDSFHQTVATEILSNKEYTSLICTV